MPGFTSGHAIKVRRLIMCIDGTGADLYTHLHKTPSNVGRIYEHVNSVKTATVRAASGQTIEVEQKAYYQSGCGTRGIGLTRFFNSVNAGEIVDDVYMAYEWLFKNYQKGDELFLFGFSRGAFTVRSLAGHISQRGIKSQSPDEFDEDYKNTQMGKATANERDPDLKIKAIGVFDTVGSLGAPNFELFDCDVSFTADQYLFHNTELSPIVENAFQALALDERRVPFAPMLWENPKNLDVNLKQTWFSGVHTNIGGGYQYTEISDITLAWMLDQLGDMLVFDDASITAMLKNNRERSRTICPGEIHNVWAHGHIVDSSNLAETIKSFAISTIEELKDKLGATEDFIKAELSKLGQHAKHHLPDVLAQRLPSTVEQSAEPDATDLLPDVGRPKFVKHIERHPGAYTRMNKRDGSSLPDPLQNTNELMHPSVRVRLIDHGPKLDDEPGHYDSESFLSFEKPPRNEGGGWSWAFKPGVARPKEQGLLARPMLEDVLGPWQKMLLDLFQDTEPKKIETKRVAERAWVVL